MERLTRDPCVERVGRIHDFAAAVQLHERRATTLAAPFSQRLPGTADPLCGGFGVEEIHTIVPCIGMVIA